MISPFPNDSNPRSLTRAPYSGAALDGLEPGTLIVDVIDAQANALIWRGWAEGALLEAPPADKLAEYVDEVVGRIMKGFPPPSESQ